MASKPTLDDALYALKIATGKKPFDAKYDVNGDGAVDTSDYIGLQKAYLGKDPGFAFAGDAFISSVSKTADEYAAIEKANQERLAAQEQENARRQTLLADANKIAATSRNPITVTAEDVANNPNLSAQQLVNKTTTDYWSKQSEPYSRVMSAINNGSAKFSQMKVGEDEGGNPITELVLTTDPKNPDGRNSLTLKPTGTPNVYQFSVYNQVGAGYIHGLIAGNPETGQVAPIQNAAQQFFYTPGSGGGFFRNLASDFGSAIGSLGDIVKELGPIATVVGNAIAPGLGTALSTVAAVDEGNLESVAKGLLATQGLNQLGVGSTIADVTGSQAVGTVGESLAKGLLSGQSFDTSLTNAVVNNLSTLVGPPEPTVTAPTEAPVTSVVADVFKGSEVEDLVSGMDLSADSVLGNSVNDIISVLTQDTVPSVTVADTIPSVIAEDTLVSGQDLAADSLPGNTVEDIITTLTQDTIPAVTGTDTVVATTGEDTIPATVGTDVIADDGTTAGIQDVIDTMTGMGGEDTLVSGQDLAADSVPGNTIEDVVNVLTDDTTVSGQDLAADATPGNTLEDVSTALEADYTAAPEDTQKSPEVPGLTNAQILNLLRFGAGLFGTTGALSTVLKPSTTPATAPVIPPEQPVTPFTGTYSGMNFNSPEYYQQVQQNYNRLFPGSNINVAEPLQQWYDTKFTPVTTKLFGV